MTKTKTWKARITDQGTLAFNIYKPYKTEAAPDVEWTLTLTFCGYRRGQRVCPLAPKDEQGNEWPMTIHYFMEMVGQVTLENGRVTGRFGASKQGQAFTLKYLGPVEEANDDEAEAETLSPFQVMLLQSTLGVSGAFPGYRNYYIVEEGTERHKEAQILADRGFMVEEPYANQKQKQKHKLYRATSKGKHAAGFDL